VFQEPDACSPASEQGGDPGKVLVERDMRHGDSSRIGDTVA